MNVPLPELGVGPALIPFAAIALSMVAITVFVLLQILPRRGARPLLTQVVLALSVIFGGSVLLLALLYVFVDQNGTAAWTLVLLAFNFMMMFPAGFWFVSQILFEDRRIHAAGWTWPIVLGVAVTGSEVLMGILFAFATAGTALPWLPAVGLGLSSIWFFWSMAAVMIALILWSPLAPIERYGSLALALASLAAPWVATYPLAGGIAGAAVMAALFLIVARRLTQSAASPGELRFLLGLSALFLAMAVAAGGLVAGDGSDLARAAFGTTMAVGMVGESGFLVRRCYDAGDPAPVSESVRETATPGRPRGAESAPVE